MADQTLPQNFLVIVDTKVESSSAFNAACWMVRSLNLALPPEMERKNKVFLVHLSSLKTKKLFTSSDKKEDRAKERERRCKSVLAWFGRRMGAFDIHYSLIGIFCESKSAYMDKINMLIDRFDIGAVFTGDNDLKLESAHIRANVFKWNRRMGFVWDKSFLKQSIHNTDTSLLKSYNESTGLSGYEAQLDTDYVEYRFLVPPTYTDFERAVIIAETCGQPVPMAAKEELIRKTSAEPMIDEVPEERPIKGKHVKGEERTSRKGSLQDLREKERAREELINAPIVQQSGFREQQPISQQSPLREPQSMQQSQQQPIAEQAVGEGWEKTKQGEQQPTARIDIQDRELPQVQILPPPEERKKAQEEAEVQGGAQRDVSV